MDDPADTPKMPAPLMRGVGGAGGVRISGVSSARTENDINSAPRANAGKSVFTEMDVFFMFCVLYKSFQILAWVRCKKYAGFCRQVNY